MSHHDPEVLHSPHRALVIQQEPVHEEVVNSLREVLLANGVATTIVLEERIRARGDIFGAFTDYGAEVHYLPLYSDEGWEVVRELAHDADLVVFNSFQLNGHAQWARRLGKPTLGLVHNPRLFVSQPDCVAMARSGQLGLLTLAPHATADLISHDPVLYADTATIGAWMFEIPPARQRPPTSRRRVTIPGAVDFRNRDYRPVLARLGELVAELGRDQVELAIVGGGQDHAALRALVDEEGLDDVVVFCPVDPATGYVASEVLYPELAASSFLLPMLPDARADYRRWKISAAVSSSIGFSVPAILDRWTAAVYDLPCVTYSAGRHADGLAQALTLPVDEVDRMRAGLDVVRARLKQRSVEEMGYALASLGARRAVAEAPSSGGADDRAAFLDFARRILPSSHSQRLQDAWALWESGFVTDGYFVEFGAVTGVGFSNSYLLERLGWGGVVAEPHPDHAEALHRNRTCTVSTKCVLDTTGDKVAFHAVEDRPALSTVAGFGEHDVHAGRRESYVEHQVETVKLPDLLAEAGAPAVIDFLSIDTEGSEVRILRAHDFERFPIRLITVEHNDHQRQEIYELLTGKGYRRKWPELSGHDDWYVLDAAYPEWSPSRQESLVAAAERIEPFEAGWEDRCRLMRELVSRDVELPPLRGSAQPVGVEAGQFVARLLAEAEAAADRPIPAQLRRFRRVFGILGGVAEAGTILLISDGPRSETPDTPALKQVSLRPREVSAARLAKAIPEDESPVLWLDVDDPRRVLLDARALLDRSRVIAVAAPVVAAPGQWAAQGVSDHLARIGLVPVARAAVDDDRVLLMFVDARLARRPPVAREAARSLVGSRPRGSGAVGPRAEGPPSVSVAEGRLPARLPRLRSGVRRAGRLGSRLARRVTRTWG